MTGLNRAYRIIWSRSQHRFVVCGELAKSRSSTAGLTSTAQTVSALKRFSARLLGLALGFTALPTLAEVAANELPTGAQVAAGQVTLVNEGSKLTLTQQTDKAIVNWNTFNVGAEAEVRFDQPSSASAILNRVLAADPSVIQGKISSNGQVFLVNPNGVLFGETASVDVGALIASTLNISNEDFLNNHFNSTCS